MRSTAVVGFDVFSLAACATCRSVLQETLTLIWVRHPWDLHLATKVSPRHRQEESRTRLVLSSRALREQQLRDVLPTRLVQPESARRAKWLFGEASLAT